RGDARDVRRQIGRQDARAYALVGDDGDVEVRVAGPVVAVGLGVEDVAQPAALLEVGPQPHRVAGLVRGVDQHEAVRGGDEAVIGPAEPGLDEDVPGQLLHGVPRSRVIGRLPEAMVSSGPRQAPAQGGCDAMPYKLLSFRTSRGPRAGVLIDGTVYDAAQLTKVPAHASVLAILEDWARARR